MVDFQAKHTNPPYKQLSNIESKIDRLMQQYSEKMYTNEDHIHIFIEGFGDRWAFPISAFYEPDKTSDFSKQISAFCDFCSIINVKVVRKDLFC